MNKQQKELDKWICPVKWFQKMYYVYVLQSVKDNKMYSGCTNDLKSRFELHKKGLVPSTKLRRPLKIIYYEACLKKSDAFHREKYLKTYLGKLFLKKNRLKSYLTGWRKDCVMNKQQKALDVWMKKQHWGYWTQHEIMVRLMEETGELARLVNHIWGPKKKKESEAEQELEMEIGDILYTLICFANSNNIDLDKAAEKSLAKVIKRDKKDSELLFNYYRQVIM